ncbi:MAG: glycosyltransferase family 8 protein [Acidimicrobiales bacterium]
MTRTPDSPWLVVTSCDDRYLWPWACTIYSAVRSAKVPIRFLLANVNGLLSQEGQQTAKEFLAFLDAEGEIVDVSLNVEDIEKYQWNATVFARLALLDVLKERFLWLDSDTILFSGWTRVFAEAERLMEDAHIVACGISDRAATLNWLSQEGTNTAFQAAQSAYVNTGVLVVDPLRWRQGGMDREWVDLVATQSERGFNFPDQDVLNYLLAGKLALLPTGFNHIVSEPAKGTELILHFAGSPKPWRLSESGRALFVATEAANFGRAKDPMWGSGQAWELFPRYWEVERAVLESLHEKNQSQLAKTLLSRRDAQLATPSKRLRLKFWGIRLLSKRLFRH